MKLKLAFIVYLFINSQISCQVSVFDTLDKDDNENNFRFMQTENKEVQ